jgi:hypothetical protein
MSKATRFLALGAASAGAVLAIGVVSAGAESGPSCADITGANFDYTARGTVTVGLILAGASDSEVSIPCRNITYTFIISGIPGDPVVVTQKGIPASNIFRNITFGDNDDNICISATASSPGGKVHDAAPDQGCLEISVGSTGGTSGFG